MNTKQLRQKILDLAIRGQLVPQNPADEPASVLLERVRAEKEQLIREGKIKRSKAAVNPVTSDKSHYGQLPDGWEICTIGEIAFVTKLAGFEYTKDIYPNLSADGVPLFKGQNVQSGEIVYEFESYIPESVSASLPRSQINRKCILTPYVGTIGNVGIHTKEGRYHLGSNVGKIELYGGVLEEYIATYIRSRIGYAELTKTKKATAQDSISIQAIRDVVVLLPPLAEQKRIVEAVNSFNALIAEIENSKGDILSAVTSAKQKILSLAIQGKLVPQDPADEPASVLLERIRAEREQLVKAGKIRRGKGEKAAPVSVDNSYYENMPVELPKTWEWYRLSEHWELLSGRDLTPSEYSSDAVGIPYITGASNFTDGELIINRWTSVPKVIAKNGDLLITCKGTVGAMRVNTQGDMHIARQIMAIRNRSELKVDYLSIVMDSFVKQITSAAKGIIPGVSREDLLNMMIPCPPLLEQHRIVIAIESAFVLLDNIAENLN